MNVQDRKETMPDEPAGECHTIEHTADIGVCCRAPTLERLFECAARAMFEIIVPLDSGKSGGTFRQLARGAALHLGIETYVAVDFHREQDLVRFD